MICFIVKHLKVKLNEALKEVWPRIVAVSSWQEVGLEEEIVRYFFIELWERYYIVKVCVLFLVSVTSSIIVLYLVTCPIIRNG